jgi:hypothetical protein
VTDEENLSDRSQWNEGSSCDVQSAPDDDDSGSDGDPDFPDENDGHDVSDNMDGKKKKEPCPSADTGDVVPDIMDDDIAECMPDFVDAGCGLGSSDGAELPAPDLAVIAAFSAHRDRAEPEPAPPPPPWAPAVHQEVGSDSDVCSDDMAIFSAAELGEITAPPPKVRKGWKYVAVEGGYMVFNEPCTQLHAHCGNASHKKCHWDKVAYESKHGSRAGQGRPLGCLALWLAHSAETATREEHQQVKKWCSSRASQSERAVYRELLRQDPITEELFQDKERPKRDDSSSEPEVIP